MLVCDATAEICCEVSEWNQTGWRWVPYCLPLLPEVGTFERVTDSRSKGKQESSPQENSGQETYDYWLLNDDVAVTTLAVVPLAGALGSVGAMAVTCPMFPGLR